MTNNPECLLNEIEAVNEAFKELFCNVSRHIEPPETIEPTKYNKQAFLDSHKLEEELEDAKREYTTLCTKMEETKYRCTALKKKLDEANENKEIKLKEKLSLEQECALLANSKVSTQDEELLEQTKMRYLALRNMTQVRFSLEFSQNDTLKGFAFNTVTKKISYFLISNVSKTNKEQVLKRIISHMEEVGGNNYADIPLKQKIIGK